MNPAQHRSTPAQIRSFGLIMLVALGIAAWLSHRRGGPPALAYALAAGGVVLCVLALAAPAVVRPVYRAWMALGLLMGRVTTPVLLTAVFVLVLLPLRLVLRLAGKDVLGQRVDRGAATYWIERSRRAFGREDFKRLS